MNKGLEKIKKNIILYIACICAIFLHFYALDKIPMAWHPDEAGSAYDAWCIANYGVDRYRMSYPVLFTNFGGGGQSALYTYMASFFVKIFGMSLYVFRIPAAIMSLAVMFSGIGVLTVLKAEKKQKIMWVVLYTILPYFFMAGRIGLDCNLMLGTSSVFICSLIYALKKDKTWMYIISGLAAGIVLYTYTVSYLVMVLFIVMTFILMMLYKRFNFLNAVAFCVPLAVLALPLIIVQVINIFDLETLVIGKITFVKLAGYRGGEVDIPRISRLPKVLKAVFLHDEMRYNSNPKFCTLYYASIPFFVAGLINAVYQFIKNIRDRKFHPSDIILLWFTVEIIVGTMLGGDGPNTNKMNGIFFSVLFYVVGGVNLIIDKAKHKKTVTFIIAIIYLIFAVAFFKYYFTQEKYFKYAGFNGTLEHAFDIIESNDSLKDKTVYIGWGVNTYIYYFLTELPSPYEMHIEDYMGECGKYKFSLPEEIEENACYIMFGWSDTYNTLSQRDDFQMIELENDMKLAY